MFRNYFRTALRSLRNNGIYSVINVGGLSASLAASILLLLWARDELSYDRFNVHAAQLYRLLPSIDNAGASSVWDYTSAPIAVYADVFHFVGTGVELRRKFQPVGQFAFRPLYQRIIRGWEKIFSTQTMQ